MGRILIALCLAGAIIAPRALHAQNPRFNSPALDSNCYFPQIGNPNEIDTICGSVKNQYLGSGIRNLGPKPDGSYGNIFIENLDASDHSNRSAVFQAATGPGFNLYQMTRYLQKLNGNLVGDRSYYRLGHFRDRQHIDIFVPTYARGGRLFKSD